MMELIAIVGEAVAGREAKTLVLRKRLKVLAGDVQRYTFDLAEALLEAQETRCFMEWGFSSLPDYAELELGVKPRKAQYLARIARVCRDCGVARKDYEPVGVSKLREITTLDPETSYYNVDEKKHEPMVDHIVRLIAEAPELSVVELEQEVAILKGMTGDNAMVMRAFKVTLSCWENVIVPCLESIRKRLGSAGRDGTGAAREYTDGNCYEALCAEYNADPRNFMEEIPEEGFGFSGANKYGALEDNNDQASEAAIKGLPNRGRDICGCGIGCAECTQQVGEQLDSAEIPQESFSSPRQVIPSE
jgi:hypothetical protein